MHLLHRLERAYLAPAPAERLAALRLLVGGFALIFLLIRLPHLASFGHLDPAGFRPIGVVDLLTGAPLPDPLVLTLVVAAALSGAAFVAGWRFALSGPLFALLLLWVTTYRNSWGMVFHTENLMVVHVLVLGFSRSADAWSLDARRRPPPEQQHPRYGWPLRLAAAITALAYLLAGIAKLRHSGLDWITSDILRNYVAWDNLRKAELGDTYSQLGAALCRHPALFKPLAAVSIAFELFAPLALLSRRIAALWAIVAWSFHVGVLAIMWIFFPYPLLGVAYAPFFEIERLPIFRRLRRPHGSA
jgi:hypothetical protein